MLAVSCGLLVGCRGIFRMLLGGCFIAESGASHASVLRVSLRTLFAQGLGLNALMH